MAETLEITHKTTLNWSRNGSSITGTVTGKEDSAENVVFFAHKWIDNEETITIRLGDVSVPKYIMFKNTEDKKSGLIVYLGQDEAMTPETAPFTLEPQEGVVLPNGDGTWYGLASTESVRLLCVAIDS